MAETNRALTPQMVRKYIDTYNDTGTFACPFCGSKALDAPGRGFGGHPRLEVLCRDCNATFWETHELAALGIRGTPEAEIRPAPAPEPAPPEYDLPDPANLDHVALARLVSRIQDILYWDFAGAKPGIDPDKPMNGDVAFEIGTLIENAGLGPRLKRD